MARRSDLLDLPLIVLSAARLTRLITTDAIGDRYVRRPVEEWAHAHEHSPHRTTQVYATDNEERESLPAFLAGGLSCPHCWGYWAGVATLASWAVARRSPTTHRLWRAVAAPLALSYVTGHVSARLDD